MIYATLGVAIIPTIGVAVLLAPLNYVVAGKFSEISEGHMKYQQKRMQQIGEVPAQARRTAAQPAHARSVCHPTPRSSKA